VVYVDPAVTDIACAGLNGLKMGDRTLTVRRATEVRGAILKRDGFSDAP
jgi:splicing factor U2AF subunit